MGESTVHTFFGFSLISANILGAFYIEWQIINYLEIRGVDSSSWVVWLIAILGGMLLTMLELMLGDGLVAGYRQIIRRRTRLEAQSSHADLK